MKTIIFFLTVLILTSCDGSNLPKGVEYSIINEDRNDNLSKTNINIHLNKKVNESTLKIIAEELKSERSDLTNLWIFYYLNDMTTGSVAWATSHYSPDLEIEIIGSTEKEDKQTSQTDNIKGEIIGKWRSEKSLMGATLILYKNEASKLMMRINWKTGSPSEEEISESIQSNLVKYNDGNQHGEYYLLEKNGNLGLYGENGKFDEAIKIK
ncbi:hypothetical protein [Fluviicola sp.]|uniref:hypothetical protein n=1 Tax=Fluviicola sp. TaxID=1917219 RepID=UPI003D2E922A